MKIIPFALCMVSSITISGVASAGCMGSVTDAEVFENCDAVAEVQVILSEPFVSVDQAIRTRFTLRLVESFKGVVPDTIVMESPGGTILGRSDYRSDSLSLKEGESYVLMMNRDADGEWTAQPLHTFHTASHSGDMCEFFRCGAEGPRPTQVAASAESMEVETFDSDIPGSRVTASGYFEPEGQPLRFTNCDGDEPIPYIIDIDPTKLPTGMNQEGAIAAVADALAAWSASSSLKFRYDGLQSFGTSADNINLGDSRLRIQLHDNFGAVNNGLLGIGGGGFFTGITSSTGGRIGSQEFHERTYGYVVLESTTNAPSLLDIITFRRVLTHEIGHALGLEHSSENPSETDATLRAATMFYLADPGSGGATIQAYDVDRIQFGYPVTNTPPSSIDRILPVVTTSPGFGTLPTGVLGVNRIQLRAFSRSGAVLTPILVSSTSSSGTFALDGSFLTFTPSGFFIAPRLTDLQIELGSFYETASIQFSDGTNLSRVVKVNVVGLSADRTPSDGLPDDWMTTNFSTTAVGALNSGRHPDDDPDKDGLSNRVEFYLNSDPNSATSGPVTLSYDHSTRQLSFNPVRFAPYWVESSSTLANGSWTLRRVRNQYQASGALISDFTGTTSDREFYRVATGP